jgi:hypothetical protein
MFTGKDPIYDNMMEGHKRAMTSCGPPGNTLVDFFPASRQTNLKHAFVQLK